MGFFNNLLGGASGGGESGVQGQGTTGGMLGNQLGGILNPKSAISGFLPGGKHDPLGRMLGLGQKEPPKPPQEEWSPWMETARQSEEFNK
jgi:hypothetical protein